MRFYSPDECLRKADQHWVLASLASSDGDKADAGRHTALAKEWDKRAREGGWSGET